METRSRKRLAGTVTWTVVIVAMYFIWKETFGQRVVGRGVGPDGTTAYVAQTREWSAQFAGKGKKFTTMLLVRMPDGKWQGYYGEFEDERWGRLDCKVTTNADEVVFHRKDAPAITYRWASQKYILHGRPDYDGGRFIPDRTP